MLQGGSEEMSGSKFAWSADANALLQDVVAAAGNMARSCGLESRQTPPGSRASGAVLGLERYFSAKLRQVAEYAGIASVALCFQGLPQEMAGVDYVFAVNTIDSEASYVQDDSRLVQSRDPYSLWGMQGGLYRTSDLSHHGWFNSECVLGFVTIPRIGLTLIAYRNEMGSARFTRESGNVFAFSAERGAGPWLTMPERSTFRFDDAHHAFDALNAEFSGWKPHHSCLSAAWEVLRGGCRAAVDVYSDPFNFVGSRIMLEARGLVFQQIEDTDRGTDSFGRPLRTVSAIYGDVDIVRAAFISIVNAQEKGSRLGLG